MKHKKLKRNLEKAVKDYIRAFEKKQEVHFDYAVADDILGVLCFGDLSIDLEDIIYDINSKQPPERIIEWIDYSFGEAIKNRPYMNYKNWCKLNKKG